MRSIDLEDVLRPLGVSYERQAKIHGSLIDYMFYIGPVRMIVLVRQNARIEDAYYLKGVGEPNDAKILIVERDLEDAFSAQVRKMGVMAVESKYILDLPSLSHSHGQDATKIDVVKSLSALKAGDRLLVLIFSCWKELLLALLLGFLIAQLFSGDFLNSLREIGQAIHGNT